MDFKNMLQKNFGNMKSKIPSMPNLPKIPKIKSRKIFNLNRSKENVSVDNGNFTSSHLSIGPSPTELQLPSTSSTIINRSPSRISTISSLVEGGQQIDYNISDTVNIRRHIHFDDNNSSNNNPQQSQSRFTERLTKQYKELSEFKFSHIFGKKTIVRKTEIQVDMYKQSFDEQNNELKAERRMSKDHDIEFRTIPANSKHFADEPQTPITNFQSIQHISLTSFDFQQSQQQRSPSNIRISDEIKNGSGSTPPPLSKRKIFNPKYDEAAEEVKKEEKSIWKIKKFKKKSSIKNNNDDDAGGVSSDIPKNSFKSKSLNNIFKKLSSFDETSNDDPNKLQRKTSMWKLMRPIRVKVSTENIPNDESNTTQDSEFMKQFNKIVGKSSKIKNLINKESSTNENLSQQQQTDDPNKEKTMEEIESFGYGRKNLKFINMWKVRRRREIRRSEPFPLNRGESQDGDAVDDTTKSSGMWQLRRATRVKSVVHEDDSIENSKNPQLAELTKSLMTLFKRNKSSIELDSTNNEKEDVKKRKSIWNKEKNIPTAANDEYYETCMDSNSPINYPQSNSSGQSRKSKIREAIGQELDDTDWKNISPSQKYLQNQNFVVNEESMINMYRQNQKQNFQIKSIESQHEQVKNNNDVASNNIKNKLQQSMDSFESCSEYSDHESLNDINKNLSLNRQNILSTAYASDSDDDAVISTPGLLHNQPISAQRREIEPTIIIVSKPVPSILEKESVIQQKRIYSLQQPFQESSSTTKQNSSIYAISQHLVLPTPVVLPTPPLPKRQFSTPIIAQPDIIVSQAQNSAPTSRSPSPPLPPTSLPPELSPPPKSPPTIPAPTSPNVVSPKKSPTTTPSSKPSAGVSLPKSHPAVPTSPRPQIATVPKLSPILQQSDQPNSDNKSQSKHSRKPSMDSTNSEPLTPDSLRNCKVVKSNKIENTFEQWNLVNASNIKEEDSLKKWKSTDIFNDNHQIFDDFDDELKNEPIISIPGHGKSNPDLSQPTGVPVSLEKHKITKPLVKQGSLRRQFSEEKDAEDLNKKRNVNKMISRFDPERFSSRRSIKYQPIQISSTTAAEIKDNENKIIPNEAVAIVVSHHSPTNIITNLKRSSSLDVEIDKNDLESKTDSATEDDSDNTDSGDLCVLVRPPTVLEKKQTNVDTNDIKVQKTPENCVKILERKIAPPPPSTITSTAVITNMLNNNQNEDKPKIVDEKQTNNEKFVIKDQTKIKSVKDINENEQNLNLKKNITQLKQQSEDNFYSLDYSEKDETVQGYPLDRMSLVREEYSIDL